MKGEKARAIGGKPTDGPVSRYLNRPISTRITSFIVEKGVPLTPNQVSVLSFSLAVLASLFIVIAAWEKGVGRLLYSIIAGVLVQASSIIDGVDGELARATGRASRLGGFLDAMMDRWADIAVIFSTSYASLVPASANPLPVAIAGLAAITGDIMVSYLHARAEASLGVHPALVGRIPPYASRDVRLLVIAIGVALSAFYPTLVFIAILAHSYVVAKTIEIYYHQSKVS